MQISDDVVRVAHEAYLGNRTSEEQAIRAALEAALSAMWRPIEEAPRDGTEVSVISTKWLLPVPASFLSREYFQKEYDDPNYMEEGWYPSTGFLFDLPEETIEPTHFMPLPPPPQEVT